MSLPGVLFAASQQEVAALSAAPEIATYDKAFEVGGLTSVEIDDLSEAVLGERLMSTVSGDGPFLVQIPPPVVDAMAGIDQPNTQLRQVVDRWTELMVADGRGPGALLPVALRLTTLCKSATAIGSPVWLWFSL